MNANHHWGVKQPRRCYVPPAAALALWVSAFGSVPSLIAVACLCGPCIPKPACNATVRLEQDADVSGYVNCTVIIGDLHVGDQVTRVGLPALVELDGSLIATQSHSLRAIELPRLERIGALQLEGDSSTRSVSSLMLPQLAAVERDFVIARTSIPLIDLPALRRIGGTLYAADNLPTTALHAPRLGAVGVLNVPRAMASTLPPDLQIGTLVAQPEPEPDEPEPEPGDCPFQGVEGWAAVRECQLYASFSVKGAIPDDFELEVWRLHDTNGWPLSETFDAAEIRHAGGVIHFGPESLHRNTYPAFMIYWRGCRNPAVYRTPVGGSGKYSSNPCL